MPFALSLPDGVPAGWSAKIYDNELPEEPHVTVRFKYKRWRISLRTGAILDPDPPHRELDASVYDHVKAKLNVLSAQWDIVHRHMKMNTATEKESPKLSDRSKQEPKGSKRGKKRKGKRIR